MRKWALSSLNVKLLTEDLSQMGENRFMKVVSHVERRVAIFATGREC